MSDRGSATRYARALLDVVLGEGSPEDVEKELTAVAGLFDRHPDLQRVLTNPVVPTSGKQAVTRELAERLALSSPVAKLMLMLAERDRLALLPDVLFVYRERLLDHQKVVRAEVTTAVPLPPDRAAALEARLSKVTSRRVTVTATVDASIIGGVVARIGSTVYDGSVATQLAKMQQRLLARS